MYRQIIDPTKSYTFSDYGKLTCEAIDLVEYFGYKLNKEIINFPEPSITLPPEFWKEIETLKSRFVKRLSKFYFSAEIARREVYVAPILLTLADWIDFTARLEYAIAVSEQLKGTLDYMLLSNSNTVVIIEAKKDDLEKGFSQLTVEMIAVSTDRGDEQKIYGAVTTGNIWQFGILDPAKKIVTQDIEVYRSPADLEQLINIFLSILSEKNTSI